MSLLHRILSAGSTVPAPLYSDDVFVSYTRTGTGASTTVTTSINLSSLGGLVWTKGRSGATSHKFTDTTRGVQKALVSNSTAAQTTDTNGLTAFGTTGHTIGSDATYNTNGATYVDWVFAKAPKFFDVVTYTGTGANRTVTHSLGSVPGCIIVKRTDTTADWQVYHTSLANTEYLVLNSGAAKATGATRWNSTTPTASVFSLGTDATVNASGGTYVAYILAHNAGGFGPAGTDNVISCGSFTSTGVVLPITLGYEPQWLLYKEASNSGDWKLIDNMRGFQVDRNASTVQLNPNLSAAESALGLVGPTSTGFTFDNGGSGVTYIYLAIRRPNKPPTLGTQVYNAIARTGTGSAAAVTGVGFAPDLAIYANRPHSNNQNTYFTDRLRGASVTLLSTVTAGETGLNSGVTAFSPDGVTYDATSPANTSGATYINWFFKRAPGVFDEVCYTGNLNPQTLDHNLAAVPELMIVKTRATADDNTYTNWYVYSQPLGNTKVLLLNVVNAPSSGTVYWNNTTPTSTTFTVGSALSYATMGFSTYVTYLFATKAGISKVGSYTGNGSSQTINCGFTTGARFVMIKRTDSTGDWYVWDSARGIVAGNDPHLSLNTTFAEVTTDDSVDADTSGFIVNQLAATNVNVTSATYIFLAIA